MADKQLKRKRFSRNKKRNWNKVDITDVEEYLDDKRLQERTGGVVSEKADEQLFFVDKTVIESKKTIGNKKQKRVHRPLKCHSALLPDPKIKPVKLGHNTPGNNPKKISIHVLAKQEAGILSKKEQIASKHRARALAKQEQKRRARITQDNVAYDLWGEDKQSQKEDIASHHLMVTKTQYVKPPSFRYQKPSGLPAVEVPHPGASYNPSYEDHQGILQKALTVEIRKETAEDRVTRALDNYFPTEKPNEATWIKEMSGCLVDEDVSDADEDTEASDRISINPPVNREAKKTIAQRNKEKRRKQQLKEAQQQKLGNVKKKQESRLRAVKSEVSQRIEELNRRKEKRRAVKEKNKDKPKKLGKLKYEDMDVEIKLSDELPGSLRLLRPEGHLLEDRFKSLQKRNIIEPRLRSKAGSKLKVKEFEKKGHKSVSID